ncbi:hypothetical protein Bca4012_099940 [Brassica carinata]
MSLSFITDLGVLTTYTLVYTTLITTISEPHIANQQATIPFYPESRELLARLDNPYYYDILGPAGCSEPLFVLPQPFFELPPAERRCRHVSKDDDEEEADVFLDDFPADMFDQVDDPNQSP